MIRMIRSRQPSCPPIASPSSAGSRPPALPEWQNLSIRTDVWLASLTEIQQVSDTMGCHLTGEELDQASRYRTVTDRKAFELRRGFLRLVISAYTSMPPDAIFFDRSGLQKPKLRGHDDLDFSVSASGHWAAIALTRGRRAGVDIESIVPGFDFRQIATNYFPSSECESLLEMGTDRAIHEFYAYWTRKEAYLKACGVGLSGLSPALETPLDSPHPRIGMSKGRNEPLSSWLLSRIDSGPQLMGTICAEVIEGYVPEIRTITSARVMDFFEAFGGTPHVNCRG